MTHRSIRVVIADDHPVFRDGMRSILATTSAVEVVGEATTGIEAVAIARRTSPDVIVMDLHMPQRSGIEATRQITSSQPGTAVLVLTMLEDDDSVFAALRAGARGYLLKGANEHEILRGIHAVAAGEAIFGEAIARRLLDFFASGARMAPSAPFPQLTVRERDVLTLIARAASNQEIATRLSITEKTVRNHVSAVFAKLHVADRAQAIVKAREAGLT